MTPLLTSLLVVFALAPQSAGERALPFGAGWELDGARTTVANEGGREVLQVETGLARRKDVQLQDGTIDVDVQVTGRRSFVYVYFRVAGDGEREEFYLRPHKSGLADAVQYAPVFQQRSAWQLYHGPGGTASVVFEPGVWTHVRVVVKGRAAALFVKDMQKPALVARLAREPRPGAIGLAGFAPPGPGEGPIARFSNVKVSNGRGGFDPEVAVAGATGDDPAPSGAGIIRAWAVSRAFVPKDSEALAALPGPEITGEFQKLETYPNGLLELHRHVQTPKGSRVAGAVARVTVRAATAGTYMLDLGFSDIATVFLNGRPIYRGNASYSYDNPRREGLIEYEQARLFLPLNEGNNELAIVVSDSFGGWGLMGRFVGAEGLTLDAGPAAGTSR